MRHRDPSLLHLSGVFTPLSLFEGGEAGAWYDMSLSTLYQDSALTTPVTATSDPVGGVLDRSPNGDNATQATASKRFEYLTDAEGRPFIRSDAVDDVLQTAVASTVVNHGGCVLVSVAAKWVTLPTDCQRFRVWGTSLSMKMWEFGTAEPGPFDYTDTDSDLTDGATGVWAAIDNVDIHYFYFAAARNQRAAPLL